MEGAVKLSFRVECPKCRWGYGPKPGDINEGYLKATCGHCQNVFFFKVAVNEVKVEVCQELSEGNPCKPAS